MAADKLTIAHVLSSFGMGGQERVALDLARVQVRKGHRVLVISLAPPPDGPMAEEFHAAGVQVVTIAKGRRVDPTLWIRLARIFRAARVDLVHTHNPQPLIYAAPAARAVGAKIVHSKHGTNPGSKRAMVLRRLAARLPHAYIAVSKLTADWALEIKEVSPERLRTIDNGVDLSRFRDDPAARKAVRGELGLADDAVLVGNVGRLCHAKWQGILIDALGPHLSPKLQLAFVGIGDDEAALKKQAAALPGARYIHFMGLRKDVPRVLAAFDVFCLPSRNEGLPLVIPEAMAMRLPVVSTYVGGIPLVVQEGQTGYLVQAGDVEALRKRLLELAADPALRRRLGEQGRESALARYAAERMADDYMQVYREVLGQGGRGREVLG
jgi:glycosyltransferase involved in cell wall biosynthesis